MIETAHLQLIPCELAHFEAILGNEQSLASLLKVRLAKDWLGFPAAQEAMQPSYEYLKSHPSALGWWTYLFVFRPERELIGLGGYKGEANNEGTVEIGYAIAPSYRGRGLATEAAKGLIDHAFSHPWITQVIAHTLAERNPSTRVLGRVGMNHTGTVHDPDDGEVWRWTLSRQTWRGSQAAGGKALFPTTN